MKTYKLFIFLCMSLMCLTMTAQETATPQESQESQSQESYPVEMVNGQKVYRYTVKQAEGLWRISKNFNVTQDEIIALNPELQNTGLRFGQQIFIPVKEAVAEPEQVANDSTTTHLVVKGETLYSLARRYGVKVEELERLNPNVKRRGLKADQVIIVPRPKAEKNENEAPQTKEGKQAKEGKENNESQDVKQPGGTKAEPKPHSEAAKAVPSPVSGDTVTHPTTPRQLEHILIRPTDIESVRIERTDMPESGLPVDSNMLAIPMRIAFLLPFCTETAKRDDNLNRFMEFYQGALLALKKLQDEGQTFDIYVYDTEKSENRIKGILARPEMRNIDAIIGPAYPRQVDIAADFAKENKIPLLVPFTSKVSDLSDNPYLLQFNPTDELINDAIIDYLTERELTTRSILVSTPFADSDTNLPELCRLLSNKQLQFDTISANVILGDSIKAHLSKDRENIIFFDTDKQPAAMTYMRRLEAESNDYKISIFGKQTWQLNKISLPVIYSTVFAANGHLDDYDNTYRHYYHTQPQAAKPRYDLLGYDVTHYLVDILRQGSELPLHKRTAMTRYQGLQSDIHCVSKSNSAGAINTCIVVTKE